MIVGLGVRLGAPLGLPIGVWHDGAVVGDVAVERVVAFSPAGMERFFEALALAPTPHEAVALALRHGWRFE